MQSSDPEDEIFVVNFNENVRLDLPDTFQFTDRSDKLERAISRTSAPGKTALHDAWSIRATTLRSAVGHIPDTASPRQLGNIGISGHRDTFFRPLKDIEQNDIITLTTLLGEYGYRVVSTKIAAPSEIAVPDPCDNEVLTLVACSPYCFVGSAPDRFIVRAEKIENTS